MDALGFNLQWFLFDLFNFVVLFWGLNKILHQPVIKLLEDRRKKIQEAHDDAERLKKEIAESEISQKEMLERARKEAAELLAKSREQAAELSTQLSKEAKEKADGILAQAEQDLVAERNRLSTELRSEVAKLVVQATEKVVSTELPKKFKEEQLKKLVKELPHATK